MPEVGLSSILNITMNKRRLNYEYKRLKKIKSRYLLVVAVFFLVLGIQGLRHNYSQMVKLRTAVAVADEQNGDVETALRELREFVYNHMNTDLSSGNVSIKPPIQLKYRYERLAKAEQKKTDKLNEAVKKRGEEICVKRFPGTLFNSKRVNCTASYISDHSAKQNPIPPELYKFDFVSPLWSADFAGISLLFSLVFFAAALTRTGLESWYRSRLS